MSAKPIDIWRLQAQEDIQGLTEALQSPDLERRKRAAAALYALDARQAIPNLTQALQSEDDPETKISLASALDGLQNNVSLGETSQLRPIDDKHQLLVDHLLTKLESHDPDVAVAAAHSLVDMREPAAYEPLMDILRDDTRSIQLRAGVADALLRLDDTSVKETLLPMLHSPNVQTRRKIVVVLGQLKAEWAVVPLTKFLDDSDTAMRKVVRAALRHIGTPEARRALALNRPLHTRDLDSKLTTTGLLRRLEKRRPQTRNEKDDLEPEHTSQPKGLLKRLEDHQIPNQQDIDATLVTRPPMPPVQLDKLDLEQKPPAPRDNNRSDKQD
ncbi:MAG: HEAT repeat domain-containing protein [Anaerolineae bacterium]|nr:HEAT repeat domain-containing protein [Anaerolineae bacterium]MCA9894881.1 HEAT repeat domain-containing protein [Anaerolineae bacterium]